MCRRLTCAVPLSNFKQPEFKQGCSDSFLSSHFSSLTRSWNRRGDRLCFTYGAVINTSDFEKPTYVFAHLYVPHPPFLFGQMEKM